MRRAPLTLVVFGAALVVAGIAPATTGLAEQSVLTSARHEVTPGAARTKGGVQILLWSESQNRRPGTWAGYVRKGSGTKVKLNQKGFGFAGGIDAPWVVYQQVVGNKSNLKLYRLDKRKRLEMPAGVNTRQWEYGPTISGKWVLFGRINLESNVERVILFDRSARRSRTLTAVNGEENFLLPGQVNGNWVVWTSCLPSCSVFIYNIVSRTKTKLPFPASPTPVNNYGAAVTRTGVVYAGRSSEGCGVETRIVRYRRSDDPPEGTELASLPGGIDFINGFARANPNGSVDFFYDRRSCDTDAEDIYKITDPPPP